MKLLPPSFPFLKNRSGGILKILFILLLLCCLLVVVAGFVGKTMLSNYLHGEGLEQKIESMLSEQLKAEVDVQGLEVGSEKLSIAKLLATGSPASPIRNLEAEALSLDMKWGAAGALRLENILCQKADVELNANPQAVLKAEPVESVAEESGAIKGVVMEKIKPLIAGFLSRLSIAPIRVQELNFSDGKAEGWKLRGAQTLVTPADRFFRKLEVAVEGGALQSTAKSGALKPIAQLGEIALNRAEVLYEGDQLQVVDLQLKGKAAFEKLGLSTSGKLKLPSKKNELQSSAAPLDFSYQLDHLPLSLVLPPAMQSTVQGELKIKGQSAGNMSDPSQLNHRGVLNSSGVVLKNLPALKALVQSTKNASFNKLSLQGLRTDYQVKGQELSLGNLAFAIPNLLKLQGKAGLSLDSMNLQGAQFAISELNSANLLPPEYRKKILGVFNINLEASGSLKKAESLRYVGKFSSPQVRLRGMPVQATLAKYTGEKSFSDIVYKRFEGKFGFQNGKLVIDGLDLEAPGLLRIKGVLEIANNQINSKLRIGVFPGTLGRIPGAESRVFSEKEEGYHWTTMNMSGPLSAPQQDLTDRLVEAAVGSVTKGSVDIIRTGSQILGKNPDKVLEKVSKYLGEGYDGVDQVRGVLNQILPVLPEPADRKNLSR